MTVHLSILSTVVADSSGRTVLTSSIVATGNSNIEMAAKQIPCQTTGALETRISDDVVKLLETK